MPLIKNCYFSSTKVLRDGVLPAIFIPSASLPSRLSATECRGGGLSG